ncbi:hypothetical protein RHMOL_Rhmol01G0082300 [Rhododendron molle]|uniref:Uncharacterized protein n=1 Tax=Rhododendron molle TaxID=49168 RepID=A0ACC0Q2J5_RHOML|nr:hypothetical protein RHMOL_Rhmol01G0082300 [Rhododendron molle]
MWGFFLQYSMKEMALGLSANKNQISLPTRAAKFSLSEKTYGLIKSFPEYFDVVVSVARKTDGRHMADLFSAPGRSTDSKVGPSLSPSWFVSAGHFEGPRFMVAIGP